MSIFNGRRSVPGEEGAWVEAGETSEVVNHGVPRYRASPRAAASALSHASATGRGSGTVRGRAPLTAVFIPLSLIASSLKDRCSIMRFQSAKKSDLVLNFINTVTYFVPGQHESDKSASAGEAHHAEAEPLRH
jgi:hypothetical protein